MQNNLKVGVVGVGFAGRIHIATLRRIRNVQIQTICDLNYDVVSRTACEWSIPSYYTDVNNMLNNEELDFITICTPPNTHAQISVKAIESDVHVLIEKPFTETKKEAKIILNVLADIGKNIKVGVVHNQLFHPLIRKGRKIFERGEIGHLLNIIIIRTIPFNRDHFISNWGHWCHKIPGGRICEALPHQIYLAQEFMNNVNVSGVKAKKLGAHPWVSFDEVQITLESNSAIGSIYWFRNAGKNEYSIFLIGSKGTLKIDLNSGAIVKTQGLSSSKKFEQILYTLSEIRQLSSSVINHYGRLFLSSCGLKRAFVSPHETCIRSFVDSILNDQEPYVNAQKGYDCTRVVEEICINLESIRKRESR